MKQTVSKLEKKTIVEKPKEKNRREGRGRVLALSRQIYRLQGKDTFYVESESCDGRYYFVRFNHSLDGGFCSCKDYESNRSEMCKHQHAVYYAIGFNTVKEVDKFPPEVRTNKSNSIAEKYKNESIRTLNELEKAEIEAEEYRTQRVLSYELDDYSF